jgi:hypothetical protein
MLEEIDLESCEEFEDSLEKLRQESKSADGTASELWFRGQENGCWPLLTTLDQKIQGTILFKDYYLLACRVRKTDGAKDGNVGNGQRNSDLSVANRISHGTSQEF